LSIATVHYTVRYLDTFQLNPVSLDKQVTADVIFPESSCLEIIRAQQLPHQHQKQS